MKIAVQGARQNNLRNVDVSFGDGLTVVTGVSGSGKSSLVFDTLYHEARRRFLEVFAPGGSALRLPPAEVRSITGLVPAVAVGQNLLNRNPASTVATATGLHPLLRLLWANYGTRHCPRCGSPVRVFSEDELVERLGADARAAPVQVSAVLLRGVSGSHRTLLAALASAFGPERLLVDGRAGLPDRPLDSDQTHDIEVELDTLGPRTSARQARAAVQSLAALGASALVLRPAQVQDRRSRPPAPTARALDASVLRPAANPNGRGSTEALGPVAPDRRSTAATRRTRTGAPQDQAAEGAGLRGRARGRVTAGPAARGADSLTLSPSPGPSGPAPPTAGPLTLSRAPVCADCGLWLEDVRPVHFHTPCPDCAGKGCTACANTGLHPNAAAVTWAGCRLTELLGRSVEEAAGLIRDTPVPATGRRLMSEIVRRLEALQTVGLEYLTLDRPSPTLSRGEGQRVRLAVCLTGQLDDLLHVLDEPTIGLHPADVQRVLPAFRQLGGPVVFVEHDRVAAAEADHAVDIGPGAGSEGGRLLFSGTPAALWRAATPTGRYFSLREKAPQRSEAPQINHCSPDTPSVATPPARPAPDAFIRIEDARLRNLAGIDVRIPLGRLTVITGVSGSGKSTLVEEVLVRSLAEGRPCGCRAIDAPGIAPVLVDQSPIGRNPRSNAATYTKLADVVRDGFAAATDLSPSHFSFNRPEGACPACQGMGAVEVAMRFLPSTWVECAECGGHRFSDEVLAARIDAGRRELNIADFYLLTVDQALGLLEGPDLPFVDRVRRVAVRFLDALAGIGLGYLTLGQPSTTLSGGEAQRVKLAKCLGRRSLTRQLLVLDEPSTGLHPADIAGLLGTLDRLVRAGATILIVEHNLDVIRAADWVVDLGPGAGPRGGRLLYQGSLDGLEKVSESRTGRALATESGRPPRRRGGRIAKQGAEVLRIRNARANNLRNVDVDIPKAALTVVTGVSGSGKSSIVRDILESEARRRFLETLSFYERQGVKEGPEAAVDAVQGLGVTLYLGTARRRFDRRATVGTETEIARHLAVLYSRVGSRTCTACGARMQRGRRWRCPSCGAAAEVAEPRHFSGSTYAAACTRCHGVGTLRRPNPDKLIVRPDCPLCSGAMYSPGFFPQGYICKPYNGGYYLLRALGERYDFDPDQTPWNRMAPEAQQAFLFGDPEPMPVHYESRTGRRGTRRQTFPGFYGWVRDWDTGGTYTDTQVCPDCVGARLRPEYLAVRLGDRTIHDLGRMALRDLETALARVRPSSAWPAEGATARQAVLHRLRFLRQVGLGYLHLERDASTLSAGEAQRVSLAALLGSGLTSLTVLVDEPSRGLHPDEVGALLAAFAELRDTGNTVIVVEHDPVVVRGADYVVDLGPGAGRLGGQVVAKGTPAQVARADTPTGRWLSGRARPPVPGARRTPAGWMTVRGARENNLAGMDVPIPLGVLAGCCGASGSGKSSLVIDTLGRALAPRKQTTSVAHERVDPGDHDSIDGAPARALLVDQSRQGIHSPVHFLGLTGPLETLYAESEDARALGLTARDLARRCSICGGSGLVTVDMGFLPDVSSICEACDGTGHLAEAWEVTLRGLALPELFGRTFEEVAELFGDVESLRPILDAVRTVGLGYLVLRQPSHALSGGETQRLKVAHELSRRTGEPTLYILDEPTVGLHLEDVALLNRVFHDLVQRGHSVLVVEHHPHVLAACDWLLELGPGGGPDGGRLIASGTPEELAAGPSPIAPHLRAVLEQSR